MPRHFRLPLVVLAACTLGTSAAAAPPSVSTATRRVDRAASAAPPAVARGASTVAAARTRKVAILVHQGVELLDFAGPTEVFTSAGGAFDVFTVGPSTAPIVSQGVVTITPRYSIADSPKPDLIVIPGGDTRVLYENAQLMTWLTANAREAELVLSVCNGAITLARTGLLDGLSATTHWSAVPNLRKFARITVRPEARFVDNGAIVTTQGVSAGIDGALHVVERLLGPEAAWADARYMMYPWEPAGLSAQARDELRPWIEHDWARAAAQATRTLAAHPNDAQATRRLGIAQQESGQHAAALATLARARGLGAGEPDVLQAIGEARLALGQLAEAAQAFEEELPLVPEAAQAAVQLGVARARARAGEREAALAALEKSTAAGRVARRTLERDPDLAPLRGDPRFEAALRRAP